MLKDYSYDYTWDVRYCYPDSTVLINRLNITGADTLREVERSITALRIAEAKTTPVKGEFDLAHLQTIHRYLFRDIYEWAGELRSVNISKGNQFCLCEHLITYADDLFAKLKSEKYLVGLSEEEFPVRLAYYLSEINVLHPFREGNGRTQRLFIEYLAENAGYHVDFSTVTDREMIVASAEAYACEYDAINAMMTRITQRSK